MWDAGLARLGWNLTWLSWLKLVHVIIITFQNGFDHMSQISARRAEISTRAESLHVIGPLERVKPEGGRLATRVFAVAPMTFMMTQQRTRAICNPKLIVIFARLEKIQRTNQIGMMRNSIISFDKGDSSD